MRAHPWLLVVSFAAFVPACSANESGTDSAGLKNEHGSSRRSIDPSRDYPAFGLAPEARVIDLASIGDAPDQSADAVLGLEGIEPYVDEGRADALFSSVARTLTPKGVFGAEVCGCREAKLTAAGKALGFHVAGRTEIDEGTVRLVFARDPVAA